MIQHLAFPCVQTHTIVQLLLLAMRQQDSKLRLAGPLLVTAQTNTAVDNILRKLITNLSASSSRAVSEPSRFLRVGEAKSVSKDLQQHCLDTTKGRTPLLPCFCALRLPPSPYLWVHALDKPDNGCGHCFLIVLDKSCLQINSSKFCMPSDAQGICCCCKHCQVGSLKDLCLATCTFSSKHCQVHGVLYVKCAQQ